MRVIRRECSQCGKPFYWEVHNGIQDASRGKYCGRDCYLDARREFTPVLNHVLKFHRKELISLAEDYTISRSAEFIGHNRKVIRRAAKILGITFHERSINS